MRMEGSPFLPLPEGLYIERVTASANELLVQVLSSSPKACCPLCGVLASRIHSRYTRLVEYVFFVARAACRAIGDICTCTDVSYGSTSSASAWNTASHLFMNRCDKPCSYEPKKRVYVTLM